MSPLLPSRTLSGVLTAVRSSKLKEENIRIRAARANGVDEKQEASVREPTPDDDEGSIVTELKKGHSSCGACRTRESDVWWKAPKGLPTNILCDSCGLSWRKYADLTVRPIREDPLSKAKTGDKREGTPVNGAPVSKRAKVCFFSPFRNFISGLTLVLDRFVTVYTTASRSSATAVCRMSTQRSSRKGPTVQAMPVPRTPWYMRYPSRCHYNRQLGMRPLPERESTRGFLGACLSVPSLSPPLLT